MRVQEEKEDQAKHVKGDSLGQIMKDPKQVALFGAYLEHAGAHELFVEFSDRDVEVLSKETQGKLAEFREGFLKTTQQAAETVKLLDVKNLNELISVSPELKTITNLNGTENVRKIIEEYLPELAVRNPEQFKDLSDAIKALSEKRSEIAEDEKKLTVFCRKYGIRQKEYLKKMEEGDVEGSQELLRGKIGWWKKTVSKKARKAHENREVEGGDILNEDGIKEHIDALNQDLAQLANVLGGVLGKNETFAKALTADLRGDSIEKKEPEMPFSEIDQFAGTDEEIKQAWGRYLFANDIIDESSLDYFEHSDHVSEFTRQYQNNLLKKKKGFWAGIGSRLRGKKVNKLIGRV